jgi:hypothetical protein
LGRSIQFEIAVLKVGSGGVVLQEVYGSLCFHERVLFGHLWCRRLRGGLGWYYGTIFWCYGRFTGDDVGEPISKATRGGIDSCVRAVYLEYVSGSSMGNCHSPYTYSFGS